MFKYVKSDNKHRKVLLLFLILNNYNLQGVTIEDAREERQFGVKYRKLYGITEELVDEDKIAQELEAIRTPIVYSPQTFELYCNAPAIHVYTPEFDDRPMIINDLGVISEKMIITRKCIISSNSAKRLDDIESQDRGFMFFMDYVLKEEIYIGKWHIIFEDKCFAIKYVSDDNGQKSEETLYMALEIDKTATYRLVLYIIKKVCERDIERWKSDNYIDELYELIG